MLRKKDPFDLEESEARKQLRAIAREVKTVRMYEKLMAFKPFVEFRDMLIDRYGNHIRASLDFSKSQDYRNEFATRADELQLIVLEIAAAVNRGKQYRNPQSLASRSLQELFEKIENEEIEEE